MHASIWPRASPDCSDKLRALVFSAGRTYSTSRDCQWVTDKDFFKARLPDSGNPYGASCRYKASLDKTRGAGPVACIFERSARLYILLPMCYVACTCERGAKAAIVTGNLVPVARGEPSSPPDHASEVRIVHILQPNCMFSSRNRQGVPPMLDTLEIGEVVESENTGTIFFR